jgi:cyclopropane-fatty-acyl-phospholipid synthase
MKTRIFTGYVRHLRLKPVEHRLQYPLYVYAIDLHELEELDRTLPLFGYNRFRPSSIYDRDYLDDGPGTIREKLLHFLEARGYADRVSSVTLITSARYFNYVFNPVSFYYCFSDNGGLVCVVAEVSNTFGERHVYIPDKIGKDSLTFPLRFTTPKEFHVSPFNDISGTYEFIFADIRKELNIRLNLYRENELAFYAELWGDPLPLTASNQLKTLVRYPFIPYLTIPRIYWEAAKLYFLRKLPYHEKPVPMSAMTIRKIPLTLFQKRSMNYIFGLLKTISKGYLTITLPDGRRETFGSKVSQSRAEININDYRFFSRAILGGDIGLGESYMEGEWDSPDPADMVKVLFENRDLISDGNFITATYSILRNRLLNLARENTLIGAKRNIRRHYDLGNAFFRTFLDSTMTYSCALFHSPEETLEEAQGNKLRSIIEKLKIERDDHVLEIGCGWGSFAIEAVRERGCRVTGITISDEQYDYAKKLVHENGMDDRITILLRDYRDMTGEFDKIVSIEMLEAVGHRHLGTFFECCDRLVKEKGYIALQTITISDEHYDNYRKGVDWTRKHIFPGGHIPSLKAIRNVLAGLSTLEIVEVDDIGLNYVETLRTWRRKFIENSDILTRMGFDRRFQRKWVYYFAASEAGFASRELGDLQILVKRIQVPTNIQANDGGIS